MTAESCLIPQHIAIIMDGNGRWAKKRHYPRFIGHRAGVKAVTDIVQHCVKLNIKVLSLFAFSSENWRRPSKEVRLLMELFHLSLEQQLKRIHKNNIRLQIIGDIHKFLPCLQIQIRRLQQLTECNTGLILNIAANYGGRWDIVQAVQTIARKATMGKISVNMISEKMISDSLTTAVLPEPDLFIRTGGEQRVSNFLLWQMAYTEFFFTDTLWPDFNVSSLNRAIASFTERERRFGKTSEQLQEQE